jgi:hypothetical protein
VADGRAGLIILKFYGACDIDENTAPNFPKVLSLNQNYPNPFNPVNQIKYTLPRNSHVRLEIYNILCQKVASLVDWEVKAGYKPPGGM